MQDRSKRIRRIATVILFVLGLALVGVALAFEYVPGLDVTPGFGMVQMAQLLLGVSALTLSGFMHINGQLAADAPRSLQADIAVRLALTGLVFCYVAGFADLLRVGTHLQPRFERPFVGLWQLTGIVLGVTSIVVGLALYHTSRALQPFSSLTRLFRRRQPVNQEDDA